MPVNYNDVQSVIAALQDEEGAVDLMELQRPDRALVLEEIAKWVRLQPGMEDIKQSVAESCLILYVPEKDDDGLIRVDPDAAAMLFAELLAQKASVSSLLYPFLVMLQNEDRGGFFKAEDLRRRLPEQMGVTLESIAEELTAALQMLRDKEVLMGGEELYLYRHFIEPTRAELEAAGYFNLPTEVRQEEPKVPAGTLVRKLRYSLSSAKSDPKD